jgi:polyphosphate kinase
VQVDLIVRGIFRPKPPKKIDTLNAISIVDRYLEHARLFWFFNNGKSEMYLGSADLMDRNLNHRIEVTALVEDKGIAAQLLQILELQLADNVKARVLDGKMHNHFAHSEKKPLRSQEEIYKLLRAANR